MPLSFAIRPAMPGVVFPPLPSSDCTFLMNLYLQLEQSQWFDANRLESLQFAQLSVIVDQARKTVPYWRDLFDKVGLAEGAMLDMATWRKLPLLKRRDLQDAGTSLHNTACPPEHGSLTLFRTSGSTGEPVEVLRTLFDLIMSHAITLRSLGWHKLTVDGTYCAIRADAPKEPSLESNPGWGPPYGQLFPRGRSAVLAIDTDISTQAAWLKHHKPQYLLTYPSNLFALLEYFKARGERLPGLKGINTIAEVLDPGVREVCREVLGVEVIDLYSSNELGSIALQCPESGLYHVQSESLLIEVIDEEGNPCAPGEVGRVIATTLHGYAMPLFRYELRDYAEVGPPCTCGRALPTLRRIIGRQRNMMILPNGEKRWPLLGFGKFRAVAPVRRYQVVQKSLTRLEFRLMVERPLFRGEEDALKALLLEAVRHPFEVELAYLPDLPLGRNGKFEVFISEV